MRLRLKHTVNLGDKTIDRLSSALSSVINETLDRVLGPRPRPSAMLTLRFQDGQSFTGELSMFQLGDANKVFGVLKPIDSRGNPVPLDKVENPFFASSDEDVVTVVSPNPGTPDNPFSFVVLAAGPLGTAQLQWQYDNLTGEGGDIISGTADIETIPGQGIGAGVEFGEQVPQ